MSKTSEGIFSCRGICWIVGALVGLVVAILIKQIWGLLVGIAVAIALALILRRLFCAEYEDTRGTTTATTGTAAAATAAAGAGAAASTAATGAAGTGEKSAAAAKAEADAKAKAEADAAREAAKAAAAKDAAKAEAAKAAEAEAARAEAAAEAAQARSDAEADAALAELADPASKDYDGDGVLEGEGEGTRPAALSAPRDGKADDLKLIKGIGPKLEQLCNELGFYHWDQIANWTADEVAWVNANLKGFKGRVTRDNWVEQAKVLAAGGETEFSKRVGDGDVY